MTGFESDWKHFFELRCDAAAHPDARKLALELYNKLYNKEYGKEWYINKSIDENKEKQ